ncbi:MAG: EamA family transporter [Sedimentisphaerales bacterium]|nr:EamA family transporter [Sedimentisphaerales bacterium]
MRDNPVPPVIFISTLAAMPLVLGVIILSRIMPTLVQAVHLYVPSAPWAAHLHLFIKAAIVTAAWMLSYYGMKGLPVSIAGPIGATAPAWTLIGGVLLFGERLTTTQFAGFVLMGLSYAALSAIGNKEGISFVSNRYVLAMAMASILSAVSGLYDKFLINVLGYHPLLVQAWFMVYLVPTSGLVLIACWVKEGRSLHRPLHWRWSIPAIGLTLVVADVLYFNALGQPGSLVSVLSMIRAGSVAVSFVLAGLLFSEVRLPAKALALTGIMAGLFVITHATSDH